MSVGEFTKEIPVTTNDEIGELKQLAVLLLGNNQLSSIPDSLDKLTNLVELQKKRPDTQTRLQKK